MPNKQSAAKELRKSKKKQEYNKNIKHNVKDLTKKSKKAIASGDASAKELVANTIKALDKATQKGVIKKNASNRKKSKLQLSLNNTSKK